MSIRFHLMLRLFIASLLLVGGGAFFTYKDIQHEARELFDAQLARSARLILSMVQADRDSTDFSSIQQFLNENQIQSPLTQNSEALHDGDEALVIGHIYETKLGFQVWDSHGNLILKSPNVPITPISNSINSFGNAHFLGNDWRVFSLSSQDAKYRCIAAERIDVRNDLVGKISSGLSVVFIILIPVLLITIWFALGQGLSSLQRLALQIQKRGADKLDSVSGNNDPTEIQTIASALNQLLSRLRHALIREKRITSDAAHELRTPLAAVKLHAELAKKARSAKQRNESLNSVLRGIDRSTHLVDQILTLARLEPESFSQTLTLQDLGAVVVEEVALLTPMALQKNIELSVVNEETLMIRAEDTALRLLARNLLTNAINYTQHGGEIEVQLSTIDGKACLIIRDNGPGIPVAERDLVLQRFYRVENHEQPGCGIGLSIVMRVVELLNASLHMEDASSSPPAGLKVTVCFNKA